MISRCTHAENGNFSWAFLGQKSHPGSLRRSWRSAPGGSLGVAVPAAFGSLACLLRHSSVEKPQVTDAGSLHVQTKFGTMCNNAGLGQWKRAVCASTKLPLTMGVIVPDFSIQLTEALSV